MEKKYCINCMEQFDENLARCPHCGYDQTADPFPFGVKPDTILRGRYLVGRVLGQGGFGITYVGYDLTLELKVAIKEYFPTGIVTRNNTVSNQVQWNTVQIDGEQWKRGCESFLKEARRMAKLDSLPGIVRVRDTFPENQTAYIVMDFVEGENLKQKLMKNGAMSLEQCTAMLRPLMESLGEMHRKGLVHRDISPDNIMIRPDGSACLLDFGAAKDITLHQSMSSQQVAKKGFSPPEQYREKGHIGSWTDVYALCATIYYCVTGKLIPDAMDRMYEETVNLDTLPGNSFGGASDVLRDGLRIHTEERIQTVEELLARLDGAAEAGFDSDINFGFDEQKDSGQEYGSGEETQKSGRKAQNNILMGDDRCEYSEKDNRYHGTVLGSKISRESIKSITFMDALAEMPDNAWDVSRTQDGTVMAWVRQSADNKGYDLVIAGKGGVRGRDCRNLFQGYYSVEKISFNNCFDTSEATDMSGMFAGCSSLTELDLSNFETGRVTDMWGMFAGCISLAKLDVSNFATSRVMDMSSMFDSCSSLTELDVSGFKTNKVTGMGNMFYGCGVTAEEAGLRK